MKVLRQTQRLRWLLEGSVKMRSDARLVKGVIRGDPEALAVLYDRYSTVTYSILLRITHDQATAMRLLEDVFRHIPGLISEYNVTCHGLDAWMVLTARSFGVDHIRSLRVTVEHQPRGAADETEIIEMAFFDGSSLKEIAQRLNAPSDLIAARLRAALQSVKTMKT